MSSKRFSLSATLSMLISGFIFLFGALALIIPSGYSYGAVLLALASIIYLFVRPYPSFKSSDLYLILAVAGYFLLNAFFNVFHHLPSRSFDNPSRFLLAIPVLLLLLRVKLRVDMVWIGIAAGAFGAGIIAIWDLWAQGESRASGHTNAIQFGDIAILFSCLLLSSLPHLIQKNRLYKLMIIAGILGGITASILSGARGGWLAIIVTSIWLYGISDAEQKRKKALVILSICSLSIIVLYQFPQQGLLQYRIKEAASDLQRYRLNHDTSTSIGSRLHMWQRSGELIAHRPLSGWGAQERAVAYLANKGELDTVLASYNHVHNDFIDTTLKRGLFGGVMLIALYVVPFVLFFRERKNAPASSVFAVAGVTLVLCVATFGVTQTFFSHASGCTLYAFLLAIFWASLRGASTQSQNITDETHAVVDTDLLTSMGKGR